MLMSHSLIPTSDVCHQPEPSHILSPHICKHYPLPPPLPLPLPLPHTPVNIHRPSAEMAIKFDGRFFPGAGRATSRGYMEASLKLPALLPLPDTPAPPPAPLPPPAPPMPVLPLLPPIPAPPVALSRRRMAEPEREERPGWKRKGLPRPSGVLGCHLERMRRGGGEEGGWVRR